MGAWDCPLEPGTSWVASGCSVPPEVVTKKERRGTGLCAGGADKSGQTWGCGWVSLVAQGVTSLSWMFQAGWLGLAVPAGPQARRGYAACVTWEAGWGPRHLVRIPHGWAVRWAGMPSNLADFFFGVAGRRRRGGTGCHSLPVTVSPPKYHFCFLWRQERNHIKKNKTKNQKPTKQQTNTRNCTNVFALTITVHLQQFITMGKWVGNQVLMSAVACTEVWQALKMICYVNAHSSSEVQREVVCFSCPFSYE